MAGKFALASSISVELVKVLVVLLLGVAPGPGNRAAAGVCKPRPMTDEERLGVSLSPAGVVAFILEEFQRGLGADTFEVESGSFEEEGGGSTVTRREGFLERVGGGGGGGGADEEERVVLGVRAVEAIFKWQRESGRKYINKTKVIQSSSRDHNQLGANSAA